MVFIWSTDHLNCQYQMDGQKWLGHVNWARKHPKNRSLGPFKQI
jgi:hypothetical protein